MDKSALGIGLILLILAGVMEGGFTLLLKYTPKWRIVLAADFLFQPPGARSFVSATGVGANKGGTAGHGPSLQGDGLFCFLGLPVDGRTGGMRRREGA